MSDQDSFPTYFLVTKELVGYVFLPMNICPTLLESVLSNLKVKPLLFRGVFCRICSCVLCEKDASSTLSSLDSLSCLQINSRPRFNRFWQSWSGLWRSSWLSLRFCWFLILTANTFCATTSLYVLAAMWFRGNRRWNPAFTRILHGVSPRAPFA